MTIFRFFRVKESKEVMIQVLYHCKQGGTASIFVPVLRDDIRLFVLYRRSRQPKGGNRDETIIKC